ncbi:MAG: 30S ribosomal protein S8 [Arcobacter butzleri]|jgi:small subunit ribosomal protein S8|nr:30S ribosomal protein S8 [Arcobacteraceae bacterium]MDY0365078.1 30S ribosomal protein S8 [Arcobacteraceae bacterium]NLO16950.1 30S ribosomal protein S8 [Aliarcobacter butzleri]
MVNDMIADALTRLRNASLRRLEVTTLLHSNSVEAMVKVFQDKGYIDSFKVVEGENNKKSISIVLKYDDNGKAVINEVTRVSKPGRRVYKGYTELKSFKNGYGTIVVSTNKGVLSNDDAYAAKVGGEVLCTIW